jgi:DNA-binding transcriptional ArsR family regulator
LTIYATLQNPALVQALSHPLRARMLNVLQEREASPKELAAEFGIPLANVAYHIQVLRKLKLIRLVKKTPRRGAVEHHYKADHAIAIGDGAWKNTPGIVKDATIASWMDEVGGYVSDAAATGGFDHSDAHMSRSRLVLDDEAWAEIGEMLQQVVKRSEELQKESQKRLRGKNHEGERRTGLVMMLFESMPDVPDSLPDAAHTGSGSNAKPKRRGRAVKASA